MGEVYFRMLDAYHVGDYEKLTTLEAQTTTIYRILNESNSLIAGKAIMRQIGVDCKHPAEQTAKHIVLRSCQGSKAVEHPVNASG